jgi:hypothetical protein
MMAYAVISQPKHEKTFPVFLEGPSQKKVSATTLSNLTKFTANDYIAGGNN